jgi:ABC-type bacteriocin/lantibiotic exporter with double-glycine peptidase domain
LEGLPNGLATPIGEGGLRLSAGERQRIGLARTLLRDAPLVLLDEPVAHLDELSEAQLGEELADWFDGRSVIVAAHRPALIGRIDSVVHLEPTSTGGRPSPLVGGVPR